MRSQVCVDASLVVALFVPERLSMAALALWEKWVLEDFHTVAPQLLRYEVTSALYRKSSLGLISREDHHAALQHFLTLDIEWIDPPALPIRATELAEQFQRPNTYNAHYLALAEHLECEFWTGDERLFNATHDKLAHIHWIGSQSQSSLK